MEKSKKLVIVGAGEFAEIAYEYFTRDSEYEVVAFAEEKKFHIHDWLFSLPVVELELIRQLFLPEQYHVFIAITYVQLNRARSRLVDLCKEWGYQCATYISPHSFVSPGAHIGENVFIFENVSIQRRVTVMDNVVIWNGSNIAHQTVIEKNCWLAPATAVAGFCRIGKNSFIGTNATLGDGVVLGADTVFGAGAVTVKSLTDKGKVYVGVPARPLRKTAYEHFLISGVENGMEDN